MKKLLIIGTLLAICTAADAQSVQQSGSVTPNHLTRWITNGVVGDAGTAANPIVPSFGVVNSGPGLCQNSGPTTGPYNQLCFAPTGTGGGFSWFNYGGATGVPSMNINGTVYPFPFSVSGVVGPSSTTIGCAAPWANTNGTLLANNCTLSLNGAIATLTGGLSFTPGQNLSVSPTGNPTGGSLLTTYSSLSVQGTTQQASNREYLINCGLTVNLGTGKTNGNEDKVCAYFGTVMNTGAINGWAINPLLTINGPLSGDFIGGQIAEFDINNNSGTDFNTTAGPSGFTPPFASGLNVSSGGSNKIGAGMWFSSGTAKQMVRGILFTNTCCGEADIESGDTATALIADWGTRSYALDTLNATYANSYAIRLGNGQAIAARNAANSSDVNIIAFNSGNNLVIGLDAGLTLVGSNFGPSVNNSLTNGTSSNGWTGLYLSGSSSGIGELIAPAAASTYAWTLPAATDTLAGIASTQTLTNKTLTLPVLTGYAIASLPGTCTAGARAFVNNGPASAPAFGSTPSSTSTGVWPVMCTGNAWIYG